MAKKIGRCKLTGNIDRFVNSHLIPQALTPPEIKGKIMQEIGEGIRAKKACTSWYDNNIVTQKGEDILTEYDTSAILELRRNHLVWTGWENTLTLKEKITPISNTHGIRVIENYDHKSLRLFGLSLLWRACVSEMQGFNSISIPDKDLETIKNMLINRENQPNYFYPISLIQISSKGKIHNQTPFIDELKLPIQSKATGLHSYKIIRFYFDGLIMHIRMTTDEASAKENSKMLIGMHDKLAIPTITYEASFQRENMENIIRRHEMENK